jgi:HPt (histidine-containing phosphotransfer) domain-containing protein
VIGLTGLLLDTRLTREQRDYAETIRASGEVLLEVFNGILDFSKMEAGKLEVETIDFDLGQIIEEAVDLLASEANSKGLELASFVSPELPLALCGDTSRLRQVEYAAHTLKGMLSNFGAQEAVAATARVQEMCQAGNLIQARETYVTLAEAMLLLIVALAALR